MTHETIAAYIAIGAYEHACGPPDEDCQPDPKGDLYELIEPAPADD